MLVISNVYTSHHFGKAYKGFRILKLISNRVKKTEKPFLTTKLERSITFTPLEMILQEKLC